MANSGNAAHAPSDERVLFCGWLLAGLSVLLPLFAGGGIVFGVSALRRDRPGHAAGMIALSILGTLVFLVYLASLTLQPGA